MLGAVADVATECERGRCRNVAVRLRPSDRLGFVVLQPVHEVVARFSERIEVVEDTLFGPACSSPDPKFVSAGNRR